MAPLKVALTLDIQEGKLAEYKAHHDAIWPHVRAALAAAGLTNISLWAWPPGGRLFYYAEYVGGRPFDEAMAEYVALPGISEWEALMHTYQKQLPGPAAGEVGPVGGGGGGGVWWRPMELVYSSDF